MQFDDPKSYSTVLYNDLYVEMWNYGAEIWCNLEGQYTTIVADLTDLSGQDYEMSICNLGVMGTQYARGHSIPSNISVGQAETQVIAVENITSKFTIGNVLDINLRQKAGTELLWVSIEQGNPTTLIKTVPAGVAPGDYTLILQSFDNNGSVKSTLKEDLITITI